MSTRTRTDPQGPNAAVTRGYRELTRAVESCTSCHLHATRTRPVVGSGPLDAPLVVLTPGPRRHEDLSGAPLAGSPANVLEHAMDLAGITTDEVHIAAAVRCWSGEDRLPTAEELAACRGHLETQLELLSPRVVVTLGAFATSVLLRREVPLERVAGYRLDVLDGVTLVPTFHPVEAGRGVPQAASGLRRDLITAKAVLDGRMSTGADAVAELRSRLAATS